MKTFKVYVLDKRYVRLTVEAENEEGARRLVESSDNAEEDYDGKLIGDCCEWCVDKIEEEK